jgi:hypothetical protein
LIGESVRELLESPCGLLVATVSADGDPRATRAWAADVVDAAAGRLRVLVTADDPVTLADLADTGTVAVTGADVRTLRAVQVKGSVAAIEPVTEADLERAAGHTAQFFALISELDGIPVELLRRLAPRTLVACVVDVREVYDQSPGPGAGASLGAAPA